MAVPKRRKSKSRVRTSRAHKFLTATNTVYCPQCGTATLPHRVCASCGFYHGKEIFAQKET